MIRTWKKAQYGSFELALNGIEVLMRVYLLAHFSDIVKLDPKLTGLALLLSLLWDAWMEPWVGRQTDAWVRAGKSRWPWVLAGALASGISLILMFSIPAGWEQGSIFAALLGASLLLNTSLAICSVSYAALVGDANGDEKDQGHMIGWRLAFGNVGALLGIAIPGYFITQQYASPFEQSAWFFVIVMFLLAFFSSLSRSAFRPNEKSIIDLSANEDDFKFDWKSILNLNIKRPSKPLLIFLVSGFVLNIGLTINSSTALYYYKFYLRFSEAEIQQVLILFFICFIISIPFWIWMGSRWGLLRSLVLGGLVLSFSTTITALKLPAGQLLPALLAASTWGGFLVGCSVLFERILTVLGKDNYGYVFGLWKMSAKIARAVGVAVSAMCLSWAGIQGFDPRVGDRLAVVFGPGVGGLILLSTGILYIYRSEIRVILKD